MRDEKVPVSLKLLNAKMAEVKGEVTTHRLETKAEFTKIDARFNAMEQRFDGKINTLTAHIDAKFEALFTLNAKTLAIVEEQNARNRFALDGYTLVYEKQLETDARLARIEKHIFGA
jgi:hypothetical protein